MPNDITTRRPFGDTAKRNLMTPEQVFANQGRIPPQATDLEEVVLGALMLEKDAVNEVIDILSPEAFYLDKHQKIFAAIKALFGKSEPIDILTVTNELKQRGELEMVGGAYYISKLTNRVVSAANIEYHARIIMQKHIQRQLILLSSEMIHDAFEDTSDVFDLLDKAESNLFHISENNLRRSYDSMQDLVSRAIKEIQNAKNADDKSVPYYHWWPREGTVEWLEYALPERTKVSSASVYWYDDQPWGGCAVPAAWRILYRTGDGAWTPVDAAQESYGVRRGALNTVRFTPVEADAVRLEVTLREGKSAGLFEWEVE